MDISVVIATHNQKERLRLVLAGLRHQRFPGTYFEVIVVDDGCTDGTGEMLKEMDEEMPLQVVSLSPNQGRCRARNQGVAAARGELVAFLDGDALPHPDWLQRHWEVFKRHGPDCLLCGMEYSLPDLELRLIPFWMAGIWPDPFLPEEMVLTDLVAFHSRYQEISPVELREIETLLHRHPLYGEEEGYSETKVDHAAIL